MLEQTPKDSRQLVALRLVSLSTLNYAVQQNDVPVVRQLLLHNQSDEDLLGVRVTVAGEPALAQPWERRLAVVPVGTTHDLGVVDLQLAHDYLAGLTEHLGRALHVAAQGPPLAAEPETTVRHAGSASGPTRRRMQRPKPAAGPPRAMKSADAGRLISAARCRL